MTDSTERYSDGRRKSQQAEADAKYRAKQREQRQYLREVCTHLGTSPEAFVTRHNAKFVAALIEAALSEERGETCGQVL